MAKTPTDLSRTWWSKNKPLTLKSTGLGEALGGYEDSLKLQTKLDSFTTQIEALKAVEKARVKAVGMCNKTLHKDALAALKEYDGLIDAEDKALKLRESNYKTDLKAWHDKRADCLAGMKEQQVKVNELEVKIGKAVKMVATTINTPKAKATVGLLKLLLKESQTLRKETQAVLDTVRIAASGKSSLHADDRDPKDFTESIDIQKVLEGVHISGEALLDKAIKKLGA